MPSIQNLVPDLANGSIIGIGAKPDSHLENRSSSLSQTCLIDYSSVHIKALITPTNRLSCQAARDSIDFNGNYLHYKDGKTTIAKIDINRPIVVSGNFSGCAYKVFRDDNGMIICAHIARPGGVGADAVLNLMDGYAGQKGWAELVDIRTTNHIGQGNGCTEVVIVSQLRGGGIDSILLEVSNTGLIVGTSDRTFVMF